MVHFRLTNRRLCVEKGRKSQISQGSSVAGVVNPDLSNWQKLISGRLHLNFREKRLISGRIKASQISSSLYKLLIKKSHTQDYVVT